MTSAAGGRRGASSLGCLFSLLVFVAALYYGVNIGQLFFRYYRLVDAMDSQAQLASGIDNGTILRRITASINDIGLPQEALDSLRVERTASPRAIHIETVYSESVHLPLFDHTFRFRPTADEQL